MKIKNKTINWFKGQILLEIKGFRKDRLINICKKNDVIIHNFTNSDDGYIFQLSSKDYKKILEYNEKIKTTLEVRDKYGLPYFFYKYRKRKIFILCFLLFIISIFIFSNYIWNISIEGNELYTKEELTKNIIDEYVPMGTNKKDIDCNELEKALREQYKNIAWISCQIKGTNLIVNIEETIPTDQSITMTEPCNITAYKDAIITDIVINNGTRVVNIGDEIKKNDVLITGVVNIYNEYEELIESSYTAAQGTVWGIVEYEYSDEFSMTTSDKTYTSNSKNTYSLNIGNNIIKLPFGKVNYNHYDVIAESNKVKLFNNLYLPIGITKNTFKEYNLSSVKLSKDEALEIANKRLVLYIDNLKKKGVSILENNVTISIENDKCIASGTIVAKEVIGIPSKIDITQEGEQQ
ncbi:MAG: sporulation protein YqfD [Lachnospiraceae bacterium]|nr:sporulation protein YqfD [Lachnospiraceae bacterium]